MPPRIPIQVGVAPEEFAGADLVLILERAAVLAADDHLEIETLDGLVSLAAALLRAEGKLPERDWGVPMEPPGEG